MCWVTDYWLDGDSVAEITEHLAAEGPHLVGQVKGVITPWQGVAVPLLAHLLPSKGQSVVGVGKTILARPGFTSSLLADLVSRKTNPTAPSALQKCDALF